MASQDWYLALQSKRRCLFLLYNFLFFFLFLPFFIMGNIFFPWNYGSFTFTSSPTNTREIILVTFPLHYAIFGWTKGGNFKSCPIVLNFGVWLQRGWGRFCKGDFADTCAEKFRWCWWGADRRVNREQTQERGPPSAPAELWINCHSPTQLNSTRL